MPETDHLPIVLLGLGHTHAHVVKAWAKAPIPGRQLIAVSDFYTATYSGMLPGVLAGDYDPSQMQIDLVRLCGAAGVRLIDDPLESIDRQKQELYFRTGRRLPYGILSVAVGSQPPSLPGANQRSKADEDSWVPIKPMQTFLQRLDEGIRRSRSSASIDNRRKIRIVIVGGGLGSLEVAMCLPGRLKHHGLSPEYYQIQIVSGANDPPEGCLPATRRKIYRQLNEQKVELLRGVRANQWNDGKLSLDNGQTWNADLVIYVGAGNASPVTGKLSVSLDERDCILTDDTLRSIDDDRIWAAGDCGSIQGRSVPKAGVFAVRQGPILWENLNRWHRGQTLEKYSPQADFLKLINAGDGTAIGQWKGVSFQGKWVWKLKDHIDRKFLSMYHQLAEGGMSGDDLESTASETMRCLGCGGKVGGELLRTTLNQLGDEPTWNGDPFVPLQPSDLNDDIALWPNPDGKTSLGITVDAMAAPFDDPFLFGQVSALHALSDLWASGIAPQVMTVSVEVESDPARQFDLQEFMAGLLKVAGQFHVRLLGGHTLEGPRMAAALTAMGRTESTTIALPKQGLQPGDVLIATKQLGTGIALAALMRSQCTAATWKATLAGLLQPNSIALQVAASGPIHAATDITGFGLAGHLREMVANDRLRIQLDCDAITNHALPGVHDLIAQGIRSSLAPSNEASLADADLSGCPADIRELLIDPQTGGGLLLAIPGPNADSLLDFLDAQQIPGWIVGKVEPADGPCWMSVGNPER